MACLFILRPQLQAHSRVGVGQLEDKSLDRIVERLGEIIGHGVGLLTVGASGDANRLIALNEKLTVTVDSLNLEPVTAGLDGQASFFDRIL